MFGLFSSQRKAPQRVPTDRVVPVGFFDDTIIFRTFVLYTLFVFDDVLDAAKLRGSLESVVSRPGWHKLGARLRRNDRGELEHHIPQEFSPDRPAIGYDHVDLSEVAIEDHPSASRIPHPPSDGKPAVVGDPNDLHDLIHGPRIPKGLDDYLYEDQPELGLRTVSFKNSTVIVLHWIHLAIDAVGMREGMKRYQKPLAAEQYALEDVGKAPKETHVLADRLLSMPGLISWVVRNAYGLAFCKKEHRMVCIPAAYLKKLREKALVELAAAAEAASEGRKETPFVSDGDVIVAWAARLAISNLAKDSERLVAIQQAYQWRPILKDLIPPERPFLSNCVGFLVTLIPAKDLLQRPLSYVASQVRRSVQEQGSREQVEAYAELIRRDPGNRAPPFLGARSMQLIGFSNWQQGNVYGLDLSSAAVSPRDAPLMPSYVQNVQGPYNFTDGIIIVGNDAGGNYWMSGYRVQGLWELMEREMAKEEI
ncbi:Putative chloramphenicol acetyltransferase-like domain superfamily [Colletotrichum destructivum]|uniref:Chloramphenicol acetyltransferase-like domain superfamily n=1 Tax=Colletotrichum destructivum TaxID=34406 RepID=A0AAX4HVF6_9PEZI|nr:Putative chloramphenicol acetyltransferase-like domain superfamily [Colletotrichum destructivum]